ncbi:MAG TPA: S8 family serine peptidase, partial [Ideonella sp.]|uniref:S8 family serine peptidase n=1 Tax=Ideonella sp. TaxID=1929293 RepID=UPI002E32E5F0
LRRTGGTKVYDYKYSFNGFAARMSAAEAARALADPAVLSVEKTREVVADTATTPDFLGLTKPAAEGGLWAKGITGENVIIGVLDSGVWPESKSFSDRDASGKLTYGPNPGIWHGRKCHPGEGWTASMCNQKLIGAQFFCASRGCDGVLPHEFMSPRDYNGHGTHTASTAGGNENVATTGASALFGSVSGIAPRARIAAYKVCWDNGAGGCGANSGDSVAAIDQAVADGVDVINFSISGSQTSIVDPVEVAFLNAATAGVFVAASAGNSGPGNAVAHNSPWLTTVGASTHDRFFKADATFGDGSVYNGASQSKGLAATSTILSTDAVAPGKTLEDARLCFVGGLDPVKVAGKVVVCDRGTSARTDKSLAVLQAGGVGMVLTNTPAGLPGGGSDTLNDDAHWIPTVHLPIANRDAVRAYAGLPGATAAMGVAAQAPGVVAPVMAAFSSRGPNLATPTVMKPDITAPGVAILAAYAATQPDQAYHDGIIDGSVVPDPVAEYLQGTSMSSPHIAGMAALLKQKHPNYWGPASIKSALMTSAGPVKLADGIPDNAFAGYGAGHANPNGSIDPGLLYQIDPTDYWRYLCGQGLIAADSPTCQSLGSIDATDLNLASFSADVPGSVTFRRTVRNLTGGPATFNASINVAGFSASVNPPSLVLEKGQKGRFTVTLTGNGAVQGAWNQGTLVWSDGTHHVRSPIMARLTNFAGPTQLTSTLAADTLKTRYQFGFTGDLSSQSGGLMPAIRSDGVVAKSPNSNGDAACRANEAGTTKFNFNVAAGTLAARFALYDADTSGHGSDDLDLFIYDQGGTLVASSAGATAEEMATLRMPGGGSYTACVHGFAPADGVSTSFTLSSWLVWPSAGPVPLHVRGLPTSVAVGDTVKAKFGWHGATAGVRYLGALRLVQGADANTGTTLGVTLVSVEPGLPQGVPALSSVKKAALIGRR